jgi:Transposase DDE domain
VALRAEAYERRPYDLRTEEKRRENPRPYQAAVLVAMEQKLRTPEGRRRYLRRQASIEPVVGIIKKVLGFEQFSLRGLQKVTLEWNLVCVAYNLKRLHKLTNSAKAKPKAPKTPKPASPALNELLPHLFSPYRLAFRWISPRSGAWGACQEGDTISNSMHKLSFSSDSNPTGS